MVNRVLLLVSVALQVDSPVASQAHHRLVVEVIVPFLYLFFAS